LGNTEGAIPHEALPSVQVQNLVIKIPKFLKVSSKIFFYNFFIYVIEERGHM
jgi:hypothetical protein